MTVSFYNPGLIDIGAVTTMGVSVKDSDNPIGYFGTGLKFAVAVILRHKGTICIKRGQEQFEFGVREKEIRGKLFNIVTLNKVMLGFTTELGKTWQPWMAYRELACNALDEGGGVTDKPISADTVITVNCAVIEEAHRQRGEFLLDTGKVPAYSDAECQVFLGKGAIFYRGVMVVDNETALFQYNILNTIDLTEDRTAKYRFQLTDPIANMWIRCPEKELLEEVLKAPNKYLERHLDWFGADSPGPTWLETVAKLSRNNICLNGNIERTYEKATHELLIPITGFPLRPDQEHALTEALDFLERAGYAVRSIPLIVTDRLGSSVLGRAANDTIYLSIEAFMMGDATLAGTILEEWLHLTKNYDDCCRSMQNWLLNAVIEQAKRAEYNNG